MPLKQQIQAILGTLGFRLVRLRDIPPPCPPPCPPPYGWERLFYLLKQRGFAPKHILDIGANHGRWTRIALKYFPDAYYTLVEPQDHLKIDVQDLLNGGGGKIRWIGAGAGEKSGILPFSIPNRDDSSTFVPTRKWAEAAGMHRIDVPVTTLDEIVQTGDAPFPDMIKIDAEGFDLRVIAGASELLGKVEVFLLEAAICAVAPGQGLYENTLANVIQTMGNAGYHVIDITDLNRSPKYGVLWLCELAFLSNTSHLLDGVDSYE
jgi:FkbM family methyltransferase